MSNSNITSGGGEGGSCFSNSTEGGGRSGGNDQEVIQTHQREDLFNPFLAPGHNTNSTFATATAAAAAAVTSSNNNNGSTNHLPKQEIPPARKKRSLPGTPDPSAEVIALSPNTLLATNRFICEICNKGFQRDQNLQLHRRGHNLPWKLKQRTTNEIRKRVYVCPEPTCVHNNPSRALGDLTGIKKHFCRKHGEKKWKCERCNKKYAVQSDWKAHSKTCGTREYKCDCGTIFSRRDSFVTHRAFCDALAEENHNIAGHGALPTNMGTNIPQPPHGRATHDLSSSIPINTTTTTTTIPSIELGTEFNPSSDVKTPLPLPSDLTTLMPRPSKQTLNIPGSVFSDSNPGNLFGTPRSILSPSTTASSSSCLMSATALLQKAAQMGATTSANGINMNMNMNTNTNIPYMTSMATLDGPQSKNNNTGMYVEKGGQQEMNSSPFLSANNMGIFGALFDQNGSFFNSMEEGSYGGNSNSTSSSNKNSSSVLKKIGDPTSGGDMMTVDFLGIGGKRPGNLQEISSHQQEILGLSRMQGLSSHHFQQQAAAAAATLEKPMWEI